MPLSRRDKRPQPSSTSVKARAQFDTAVADVSPSSIRSANAEPTPPTPSRPHPWSAAGSLRCHAPQQPQRSCCLPPIVSRTVPLIRQLRIVLLVMQRRRPAAAALNDVPAHQLWEVILNRRLDLLGVTLRIIRNTSGHDERRRYPGTNDATDTTPHTSSTTHGSAAAPDAPTSPGYHPPDNPSPDDAPGQRTPSSTHQHGPNPTTGQPRSHGHTGHT